jgi:purine-binding chemotaxis protein CheW
VSRQENRVNEAALQGVGIDASGQGQYLTFRLATEEYGIDILSVQEIKGWSGATSLPESPPYLLGVINLRGSVVPIVDLRKRFGLAQAEFGPTTVVIVARVDDPDGARIAGFVVDAVCEVYTVGEKDRRQLPEAVTGPQEFVQGLATVDDKMIILLDIERLLTQAAATTSNVAQAA